MTIKAMEQAIEALNEAVAFREGGRQKAIDAITALRTAIQQAEAKTDEPVFFVSPAQARAVNGKNRCHYTPSDNSGRYLQVRATPAGLFTQPVYTHPAPGVPDDVVRDAERYRWLLCNYLKFSLPDEAWKHGSLDAAIDAAMTASPAQKG